MIARGEFRSDLYYRLNVFPVVLPPLRNRKSDIPELVSYFVRILSQRMGRPIHQVPPETIAAFTSYSWPGNIRELQNLVERAVILSSDGVLANPLPIIHQDTVAAISNSTDLKEVELALILQALEAADWVVGGPVGAAAKLGLNRTTLAYKMNKLGISRPLRMRSAGPPERIDYAESTAT
jgi:transcriptional regulator with GAF, ATPase, and Fis domain